MVDRAKLGEGNGTPPQFLLPGKSPGQRSLVGCSPWGRKELDTTERLHFHFSLSCIGEGNGNPLQCSCLENPRDSRAWWAAVYGVTQSRTRLKWLSSSRAKLTISQCLLCIEYVCVGVCICVKNVDQPVIIHALLDPHAKFKSRWLN